MAVDGFSSHLTYCGSMTAGDFSKNSLFYSTLKWASDRGTVGFKISELRDTVSEEEYRWIEKFMMGNIHGDPPLIHHGETRKDGEYIYFLTGSGSAVLIDYLELNQARMNSQEARIDARRAINLAWASFGFAAVIGVADVTIEILKWC